MAFDVATIGAPYEKRSGTSRLPYLVPGPLIMIIPEPKIIVTPESLITILTESQTMGLCTMWTN